MARLKQGPHSWELSQPGPGVGGGRGSIPSPLNPLLPPQPQQVGTRRRGSGREGRPRSPRGRPSGPGLAGAEPRAVQTRGALSPPRRGARRVKGGGDRAPGHLLSEFKKGEEEAGKERGSRKKYAAERTGRNAKKEEKGREQAEAGGRGPRRARVARGRARGGASGGARRRPRPEGLVGSGCARPETGAVRGCVRGPGSGTEAAGGDHGSGVAAAVVVRAWASAFRSPRGPGSPCPAVAAPLAHSRPQSPEGAHGRRTDRAARIRLRGGDAAVGSSPLPAAPWTAPGPALRSEAGARGGRWARAEPRPEPAVRGRR